MFKNLFRLFFLIVGISLFNNSDALGQKVFKTYGFDTAKIYKIRLIDETEFVGKYLYRDSSIIVIKTNSIPKIEVPINKISSIDIIENLSIINGKYWFPNPNPTRYLFAPSAFNLKKGEGYYQNTYVTINSFNVGLTDNFSIGGGLELITLFTSSTPLFFITPKVGFKVSDNLHLGGGIMLAGVGTEGTAGMVYGLSTFGSLDNNFTTGLGWGFVQGKFSGRPFITISGVTRISRGIALVTENWFIPLDNYYGVFSYGIRFFGEKISVDLAFLNNSDIAEGIAIGIPYFDFVVKFK